MHDPLIDGGVIRKLWVNETDLYRGHLLRRKPPQSVRRRGVGRFHP